jgi:hypothetical protein
MIVSLRSAMPALACLALAGCGEPAPSGDGGTDGGRDAEVDGTDASDDTGGDASDADVEGCYQTVDVVFVLDVSSSMAVLIRALESQLGMVWATAAEHDSEPHFGLVAFVDDVVVDNGGQPFDSIEPLRERLRAWADRTATNSQAGVDTANTDWPENTLDALCEAATGFAWRDEETTLRVIIHATDDSFLEHPYAFSSSFQVQHTYAETIGVLQEGSVRVATFAAHQGGPQDSVDTSAGFFAEYREQTSIPEATSGLAFEITEVGSSITLSDAIVDFVEGELCEEYVVY